MGSVHPLTKDYGFIAGSRVEARRDINYEYTTIHKGETGTVLQAPYAPEGVEILWDRIHKELAMWDNTTLLQWPDTEALLPSVSLPRGQPSGNQRVVHVIEKPRRRIHWQMVAATLMLSPIAMALNWTATAAAFLNWNLPWTPQEKIPPVEILEARIVKEVLHPGEPLKIGFLFRINRVCLMAVDRAIYTRGPQGTVVYSTRHYHVRSATVDNPEPINRVVSYPMPELPPADYTYREMIQSDCGGGDVYNTFKTNLDFKVVTSP